MEIFLTLLGALLVIIIGYAFPLKKGSKNVSDNAKVLFYSGVERRGRNRHEPFF